MTNPDTARLAHVEWRKSSHSGGGNQCVEVAQIGGAVAVRDSKDPGGGHLTFDAVEWAVFLGDIKDGNYML